MNQIKALLLFVLGLFHINNVVLGQDVSSISIEECYEWARENMPLIQQLDLIEKAAGYNLNNASKGYLPQVNLNGQISYQSEVTKFPISLPNIEIPELSKDQYKVNVDIYQPLTHFKTIATRKEQINQQSKVDRQQIEVALYKLQDRVNQVYFGMLLIDRKMKELQIIQVDLDSTLIKVQAAEQNGLATLTDIRLIAVEQMGVQQKVEESLANKMAFATVLSGLTGKNIQAQTVLSIPQESESKTEIKRPELLLYSMQRESIILQRKQIENRLLPNAGLFLQVGYGRPAINFLENEFSGYYIGGLRLNWNISNFYTTKNDRLLMNLSDENISIQKETFLLNTHLTQGQQSAEIEKFRTLIESDREIVELRQMIKETAEVQLSNGIITSLDYIKYLSELNRARENLVFHQTQMLSAQYNLKTTTGN